MFGQRPSLHNVGQVTTRRDMKLTALAAVAVLSSMPSGLEAEEHRQTLKEDAAVLTSKQGATWKSKFIVLKLRDGSQGKRRLVMKFAPTTNPAGNNAPDAKVELWVETEPSGIKGLIQVDSSLSTGGYRDVFLRESEGVRTLTIRKAPEKVSGKRSPERLEKILNLSAISFSYELKGKTLKMSGFPSSVTKWGSIEFTTPSTEIPFTRTGE